MTKTIDLHYPQGEKEPRCPNITNNNSKNILKCTDDNINDFINFLKQQPNYSDTLIVILPDHLYFDNGDISKSLGNKKDRKLYAIILNSGKKNVK